MKIISRTLAGLGAALALGLSTSACSALRYNVPAGVSVAEVPPGPHPKPAAVVFLHFFSFVPAIATIKAGQTIEWIWQDPGVPHNVTFGSFHSPTKTAGVYYHTFNTPGAFYYVCTLHYNMRGEVIVQPG